MKTTNSIAAPALKPENLISTMQRLSAMESARCHISGLVFPENLWHRIGQAVKHYTITDANVHGNAFMGFGVETSKIIPENQIVIMQGRMPIGLITLADDGTATINMIDEATRKSMMRDTIHDVFHADIGRFKDG